MAFNEPFNVDTSFQSRVLLSNNLAHTKPMVVSTLFKYLNFDA